MFSGCPRSLVIPWMLWAAVAAHTFSFGFVWDDIPMIDGPVIHDLSQLPAVFGHRTMYASANDSVFGHSGMQTYRPLTIATLMIDAALYGRAAWGYHLSSLCLHLIAAWMVLVLTRKLAPTAPTWVPFAAATWFAMGPFLVEAYVWINGRSDLLATLFGVALAIAYLRVLETSQTTRRIGWQAACALLALACLLSKETGVAWLLALVVLPTREPIAWRARISSLIGPVLGAAAYGAMRLNALSGMHVSEDSQVARALLIAPYVVLDALSEIIAPRFTTVRFLEFEMRHVATTWLIAAWIALGGLVLASWLMRRRFPGLLFGVVTAVVSLLPVALIATMRWPGFGRYVYSASAALAPPVAVIAAELSAWVRQRDAKRLGSYLHAAAVAFLVLLGGLTFLSALQFADEHTLYESWIAGAPDQPHGYRWLGLTYMEDKKHAEAFDMLERARHIDREDPTLPDYQIQCLQALGEAGGAIAFADQVAWDYRNPHIHELAMVGLVERDRSRALAHARRCLELDATTARCQLWQKRLTTPPPPAP